ncbi:MAG TPA: hypothetical protein VJY12_07065 [Dysgonamonadaceae bacterium]|nr:hypothetical protein [Dysgonamonadaceae bacterium]
MKNRILLKEIPSGKFHSAIFTTYSINLYYLEQQVLPLLGSKGIHYVSILADGAMLSTQLENYGYLSQTRKRNYSVHGIQSSGAFHPKLIFLAGPDSILLLVGSGNLTSSGHGKNLEVWNPVYVSSLDDAKYGFVIQAWNYMKQLHADLGDSANSKLKSIEENCFLLSNKSDVEETATFDLDGQSQISFHANSKSNSLFTQVSEIVGDDEIENISIMCPFHNKEGKFIHELNKRYSPKQINVIIQENFGSLPFKMAASSNVRFFEWTEVLQEKQRQSYFHAKNIILEGKNKNYLISGSANASIAAFGSLSVPAKNQESCIIYQSAQVNYHDLLSLETKGSAVNLRDYEPEEEALPSEAYSQSTSAFIKSAEKNFEIVNLIIRAKDKIDNASILLFDSKGIVQFQEIISWESGEHNQQISISSGVALMFAQVSIDGKEISNRQFITDINAFESTNPSPRNRSLNQIRKLIESGNFSTPKIIDYLNTIYKQKETKKGISKAGSQEERDDELPEEKDDNILYLSYAEIQERAKQIDNQGKIHHYIEYKGVRLWESIFSYLKESREKELQAKIDEEETEDINSSGGRSEKKEPKAKRAISKSSYDRLKDKVIKFLDSYHEILSQKTTDPKSEQPSLIDLSMYLIMLEILLHLIGHKETIAEEDKEKHLLTIPFSKKVNSWSEYLIQFIGMFTMWCAQQKGFKDVDSADYRLKLEHYQSMAFKTNLSALSICKLVNEDSDFMNLSQWYQLNFLNSNLVFNSSNHSHTDTEEFISFVPQNVLDNFGETTIEDEISNNLTQLTSIKIKTNDFVVGDFYYHSELGFTFLDKVIQNPNNTFYKLFTPGFEWDEEINNFWNGQVFSIKEKRWLKSRKD